MEDGNTNRIAAGKSRIVMALPEGDNASENIFTAPGNMEGLGEYLKCLHTSTCSMRNKQDELEMLVSFQTYNIIGRSQTSLNESHDWSAGYRPFRRDRQGRQGGGVTLYVRKWFHCTDLTVSDDEVESLCASIRGQ